MISCFSFCICHNRCHFLTIHRYFKDSSCQIFSCLGIRFLNMKINGRCHCISGLIPCIQISIPFADNPKTSISWWYCTRPHSHWLPLLIRSSIHQYPLCSCRNFIFIQIHCYGTSRKALISLQPDTAMILMPSRYHLYTIRNNETCFICHAICIRNPAGLTRHHWNSFPLIRWQCIIRIELLPDCLDRLIYFFSCIQMLTLICSIPCTVRQKIIPCFTCIFIGLNLRPDQILYQCISTQTMISKILLCKTHSFCQIINFVPTPPVSILQPLRRIPRICQCICNSFSDISDQFGRF